MRILTQNQKEFLLEYFFKNETYPGWESIATTLIETGECIVNGDKCIWLGGVGNFIKTKTAERVFGCLLYVFDLEYFLTSEWVKDIHRQRLEQVKEVKEQVELEYNELSNLL